MGQHRAGLLHGNPDTDREVLCGEVGAQAEPVIAYDTAKPRGGAPGLGMACVGHDDQKLLASNARDKIVRAHIVLQDPRQRDQSGIACGVTEGVVDAFEVINVYRPEDAPVWAVQSGGCRGL